VSGSEVIGYGCETGKTRELFADAVNNLNGRALKDDGKIVGRLLRAASEKRDAMLRLFIRDEQPCQVWRTVTPIVFTGLTRRGRPPEKLIARALIQAGFTATDIDSVAAFSGPILPKTTRALEYRVNGYLDSTPRYHAEVIFKRPVIGPLVIGRGRHAGFGLMMPYLEAPSKQYLEIR
jgi:CRISPR-associated protein Csb2